MPTGTHELEALLTDIYTKQVTLYGDFLRLASSLPDRFAGDDASEGTLQKMNAIMTRIHELDLEVTPQRETWQKLGVPAGPSLAACLKQVENLILAVMERLQKAELDAQAAKERLFPKLSTESKRAQMTRAYRSALDS